MCGIAGILSTSLLPRDANALLAEMSRRIAHRGPDDAGEWQDPSAGVALAHRRLSIIDLSPAGHQPMVDARSQSVIIFNGEIYNFQTIRDELIALGHTFRSHSDTEVILEGYRAWGKNVVHKLRGMFAFALWDARERKLWLVRDRLGKKPLFFWQSPDRKTFLFASEIKSILAHRSVKRELNRAALSSFLQLGYVVPPWTMFQDINKLPGGHWLEIKTDGTIRQERYWRLTSLGQDSRPVETLRNELRDKLTEAVRLRLISDVPVGAYLSGGVDSSTSVALMTRFLDRPVDTFSVAHNVGPRSVKYNVDSRYARLVSSAFDTNHRELILEDALDLRQGIEDVLTHLDEPFANYSYLSTYGLAKFIQASGVTVVLSGDGGDEVFGGYPHYALEWRLRYLRRIPHVFRHALSRLHPTLRKGVEKAAADARSSSMYFNWRRQLAPELLVNPTPDRQFLARIDETVREAPTDDSVERLMYADLMLWIAEESNMRMDKLNLAFAVESRAPFLDHTVVEFGANLPLRNKVTLRGTKVLLRQALADLLPSEVLTRPKWGFFAPVHYWMKDQLHDHVASVLTREAVERVGIFRYEPIEQMLETRTNPYALWTMMTFHRWVDRYLDHEPVFPTP